MLRIIFDLDDVLIDTYSPTLAYLTKNYGIKEIPDFHFKELGEEKQNQMFDELLGPDNCINLFKIKPFCQLLFYCVMDKYKIWIVTTRMNKIRQDGARKWLRNNFSYTLGKDYELVFKSRDEKPDFAVANQVDIAIDDCPDTAIAYAKKGIRVLLPLFSYNKNISYPLGVRCIKIDGSEEED